MEIRRVGSQPSAKGSPEWFTGTVRVDPLFEAPEPPRLSGASVTFEPAHALRGIRIRSVRLLSSQLAAAWHSAGEVRLRKFDRVT